jgi:hypothetical protein
LNRVGEAADEDGNRAPSGERRNAGKRMGPTSVTERLTAARTALRRERRVVADEREAFEAFHDRLQGIEPDGATTTADRRVLVAGPTAASAETVRDAYVATVMSVPHYDEEYGEPYCEHLAAEFGIEVAAALDSGFDARTKRAMLTAADGAHDDRARFVVEIDAEAASLSAAEGVIEEVRDELAALDAEAANADRYGTLDAIRARLGVLADHCEEAADERQADVDADRETFDLPGGCPDVQEYLYADLDASYPALASLAELGDHVRRTRRRVERRLARIG